MFTSGYITTAGDFYLCGWGGYGLQGNGSTSNVTKFTKRASGVTQIVLGQFMSGYLTTSGDFYLCGRNNENQQGDGTTTDVLTFTKRASGVAQISLSDETSGYVTVSGDLYLCGNYHLLGTGEYSNLTTFTKSKVENYFNSAKLTINPTPSDAIVTINGETVYSADIRKGTTATWEVSVDGYKTKTGTTDRLYSDLTIDVELEVE